MKSFQVVDTVFGVDAGPTCEVPFLEYLPHVFVSVVVIIMSNCVG